MIELKLFNTLTIAIFNRCILQIRLDTSRLPFSFDLKLGLFYPISRWYNNIVEYDKAHNVYNKTIDIICPILFDLNLIIEQ